MEVALAIFYHESVLKKDIPKLSSSVKDRIKNAIEDKVTSRPEVFGKPLRHSKKGYRKLRVGDYRVIFRMGEQNIKILVIGHRSSVYQMFEARNT